MNKLYRKCYHENITYKELLSDTGDITIFAVKCVECQQEMPEGYTRQIMKHYLDSSSPIQIFPTYQKLQQYKKRKQVLS